MFEVEIKQDCKPIKDISEVAEYYTGFADYASFSETDAIIIHKGNSETNQTIDAWKGSGLRWHKFSQLRDLQSAVINKYTFTDYFATAHGVVIALVMPTRMEKQRIPLIKYAGVQQAKQTLQPEIIEVIDYAPKDSSKKDVTERYRFGYERAEKKGADLVLAWEDDDWYDKNYINVMVNAWVKAGKPVLIGIAQTLYYNIFNQKYLTLKHLEEAV